MSVKLAKRVKDLRLQMGNSQVKMSVLMDISLATLIRIENGDDMSDLILAKVERFLKEQKVGA